MTNSLTFVYLLETISKPVRRYVGVTDDLDARLAAHNEGRSTHTAKYRPWRLVTFVAFTQAQRARAFERYLKSGSGQAFAKAHLW